MLAPSLLPAPANFSPFQVGMVGTSTPFHSADGSAYTLFYGDDTAASGAVGVAVVDASPEHRGTPVALNYGGLAPIGASYEVTRSVVVFRGLLRAQSY